VSGGPRKTIRGRSPGWTERPYGKRRARVRKAPEQPRPVLDLIVALAGLIIAIGGALFIGLRMLIAFKLPLYLGFGGILILLGAACVLVAPRGLARLATAIALAISLVTGMVALYPGGPW
jgi:hypothetical protein